MQYDAYIKTTADQNLLNERIKKYINKFKILLQFHFKQKVKLFQLMKGRHFLLQLKQQLNLNFCDIFKNEGFVL